MIFLGTTFFGGKYTSSPTPTHVENMTNVELSHGLYTDLYISKDVDSSPSDIIPSDWNWNAIMKADYSTKSTNAGNVTWTLSTVSDLAIKRRIKGQFNWITIDVHSITTEDDFNFVGEDKYAQSNLTYEYAIVPYLNDNPGVYVISEVESIFDGIYIIEKDKTYKSVVGKAFVDTTRNISGDYNVPIHSKYPVFFDAGSMNYDSGTVDGMFFEFEDDCIIKLDDYGYIYKKGLMDFLTDDNPKVLKHSDGRIWLIDVIPSPTDSGDGNYKLRNITFSWIQVGEADNVEHLYYANLIDLPEKWW